MTCDECKEQVLELIEREAHDAESVREVLDRCPDCRALFDEMKAALALADELPRLEPPAEVDAAILRAARAREMGVTRVRRRWFQSPEWAVAAVALLAVGVGVWAIPRGEEAKPVAELAAPEQDDRMEQVEPPLDEAEAPSSAEVAWAGRGGAEEAAPPKPARQVAAKSAPRESRPEALRRRSKGARDAEPSARVAAVPAVAEPEALAGSAADVAVADQAESFPEAEKKKEQSELSRECARRLARVERRRLDDDPSGVPPEDALAIGECYRTAGKLRKARLWLERASLDEKTKERAMRALRELPAD